MERLCCKTFVGFSLNNCLEVLFDPSESLEELLLFSEVSFMELAEVGDQLLYCQVHYFLAVVVDSNL